MRARGKRGWRNALKLRPTERLIADRNDLGEIRIIIGKVHRNREYITTVTGYKFVEKISAANDRR